MRASRGIGASLLVSVVCVVLFGASFGLYFISTQSTLVAMSSKESSLSASSSEASEILVAQQSSISCLETQVSYLRSELSTGTSSNTTASSTATALESSCASSSTGPLRLVNLTGSLTVPSGAGEGSLIITVWNGAQVPITAISVNTTGSGLRTQTGPPVFYYGPQPISITNPMPYDATVSANATIVSGSSGLYASYGYDFEVLIVFSDGFSQSQQLYIQAEV